MEAYSVGFDGVWIVHIGRQGDEPFDQFLPSLIHRRTNNKHQLHPPAVRVFCSAREISTYNRKERQVAIE